MVFRGRLVGGFPPTPALILLSIKAPKEQEKKKAMYLHPTPTKEEDIPKGNKRPVRLDLSAESAAIQQCFSLTTNQRTVLSAQ
jgi:hypothetical protein